MFNTQEKMSLKKDAYMLLTLHRQENVDDKERLKNILEGLRLVGEEFNCDIIY